MAVTRGGGSLRAFFKEIDEKIMPLIFFMGLLPDSSVDLKNEGYSRIIGELNFTFKFELGCFSYRG